MSGTPRKILFCTVGGNDVPVVRAIQHHAPDHVVFVCSKKDPATDKPGSSTQICGPGQPCGVGEGPRRPNIPAQVGLSPDAFEVLEVPPDKPHIIASLCEEAFDRLGPDAQFVIDYTGGTKSMSVGIAIAGALRAGVTFSIITGARTNLQRVEDGFESAQVIDVGSIHGRVALAAAAKAWRRHAYAEALVLLSEPGLAGDDLDRAKHLSRSFAAWDAFAYEEARSVLRNFGRLLPQAVLDGLGQLCRAVDDPNSRAARIVDTFHAVERRLAAGQPEVAALLAYRCLELVARYALCDLGIEAGNVEPGTPADRFAADSHDERRVLGMEAAWKALADVPGPYQDIATTSAAWRKQCAAVRNASVYTHGNQPVTASVSRTLCDELKTRIVQPFVERSCGGRWPVPQLPDAFP